jgi:hypothetical protein
MITRHVLAPALLAGALAAGCSAPEAAPRPKYATDIPATITTPDAVPTRLGTLHFVDGIPTDETVATVRENLLFTRGVEAFLAGLRGSSVYAYVEGLRSQGLGGATIGITETLMDARSLFLTPNTDTVYALTFLDLKNGPVVVESPPNTLGICDDAWFDYVTDLGNAGPDKGQGGKYLFLPPDFEGTAPEGYFTFKSPTFINALFWRGFLVDGDPAPAVQNIRQHARIYPLAAAGAEPETRFVDISGREFNTVHPNDYRFFVDLNQVVQSEPNAALDPETLGLFASIGIEQGKFFAPDARTKATLAEAAAVGNATARAICFAWQGEDGRLYPDSQWQLGFVGGSYQFEVDGVRQLDARTRFFYYATGVTPAMSAKMVGAGSQYAAIFRDADGRPLDGGHSYRLRIPANAPVKDFWSIVVYDNQTRSLLQTDQQFPSVSSHKTGVLANPDGSVDVYFGPAALAGQEANWVQTLPGKGWNALLRLYGPLEPWFDKTWRPGEIEPLN